MQSCNFNPMIITFFHTDKYQQLTIVKHNNASSMVVFRLNLKACAQPDYLCLGLMKIELAGE